VQWTDHLATLHRMDAASFDGALATFQRDVHPDDAERVWAAISAAAEAGGPYRVVYRSAHATDVAPLWIEASGGVTAGSDGERYLTGICFDVTERVLGERELARRLRQQQGIQGLSTFALGDCDLSLILDRAVAVAADVLDVPLAEILQFADDADDLLLRAGVGWKPGLVGTARIGIESVAQAGHTLSMAAPVVVGDLQTDARFKGPSLLHEHGVRSGMTTVIAGDGGRPFGVLGVHATEIRQFDQNDVDCLVSLANIVASSARQQSLLDRQRLLMREMAHRSGNLLQVVSSLAAQTFRAHADPAEARRSFTDRLDALARANYLIAQGGWAPTRFISLLGETLGAIKERVVLSGRDILLPSDLSFDLGLIIHELATNSIKYGSLSRSTGVVHFEWKVLEAETGERRLRLVWRDGSPSVSRSKGGGFGARLKRAIIETKWNGTISVDQQENYSFVCEIPLPSESVAEGSSPINQ